MSYSWNIYYSKEVYLEVENVGRVAGAGADKDICGEVSSVDYVEVEL